MATNTILINRQCCIVCQTRIHKSNKKIQCVLCFCCAHKSCVESDSESYFCTNCIHNTLPLASISDSDFLNLTLGQFYLRSKANRTKLKLDLLHYDSIENKLIDDECIDADNNHYNYIFGDILDYSDTEEMNHILSKHESVNLKSILHLNVRSLVANQDALYENLQTLNHKFSILAITETWTTPHNENVIDIPGYTKMLKSRTCGRGGGVGLFFDNNLEIGTKLRDDLACPDTKIMESLFVQISQTKLAVKDVIVGVIYRPPNTNVTIFCDSLSQILDKINKEDRPCYLLGDFNIDFIYKQPE